MKKGISLVLVSVLFIGNIIVSGQPVSASYLFNTYTTQVQKAIDGYVEKQMLALHDEQEIIDKLVALQETLKKIVEQKKRANRYTPKIEMLADALNIAITGKIKELSNGNDLDLGDLFWPTGTGVTSTGIDTLWVASITTPVLKNWYSDGLITHGMKANSDLYKFYKGYDSYLFTPTSNGVKNGQPWSKELIDIQASKISSVPVYSTKFNNYNISVYFGSRTSMEDVKNIRSLVVNYPSESVNIDDSYQTNFFFLNDNEFTKQSRENNYEFSSYNKKYNTYRLYVAKDNSQAFIVEYVQESALPNISVSNPTITIISPNGGETFKPGEEAVVRWKTTGLQQNVNTQLGIKDDRIRDWTARSFFGAVPVLNHAKLLSSNGSENTYEYTFMVPENFNSSLPSQYQDIYGGNHYKMEITALVGGQAGTSSQRVVRDNSDFSFSITKQESTTIDDIKQMFRDYLGREAELAGLDYWVKQVPTIGLEGVRWNIKNAARESIKQMYMDYLGHEADTEGLDYWAKQASTIGLEGVRWNISNSPEAKLRGTTSAGTISH